MYIYDRQLSGAQSLRKEHPITSWPTQRYHYLDRIVSGLFGGEGHTNLSPWTREGLGQLSTQQLSQKLKHLSLLPHFAEVNGKDVALTPAVMNPGIYDGSSKYKFDDKQLQPCLMNVMQQKKFRHIKVTLVDLTKGVPITALFNHKDQVFAASVPKIAAMLAAFQLRHDLRVVLKQTGAKTRGELFDRVRDDWAATQRDPGAKATPFTDGVSLRGKLVLWRGTKVSLMGKKLVLQRGTKVVLDDPNVPQVPQLEHVFAGIPDKSPVTINFSSTGENKDQLKTIINEFEKELKKDRKGAQRKIDALGFLERLRIMMGGLVPASNYATSTIVRDVGFLYIASTLLQSGLYDTNRNGGLWLGADYWGAMWRGPLAGGQMQSATAGSLAAFMTLLAQNRLVSPQASAEMSELMKKEPNPSHPGIVSWFKEGLKQLPNKGSLRRVLSKLGVYDGIDDCTFIEREVDLGSGKKVLLRYVAVGLRANSSNESKNLIRELDKCILVNNGLTPAQGGHPL
jgi:hypothetical protein